MLRSNKQGVPLIFSSYMKHHSPHAWGDVNNATRRAWRDYILHQEQQQLSLYTEEPCDLDASHIDHFVRRTDDPKLTFRWDNYIVDGLSEEYGAKYKDNPKNHSTINYSELINPVLDDPSKYFYYTGDGAIMPSKALDDGSKRKAKYTIAIFNLNHPSLMQKRKNIFDAFAYTDNEEEAKEIAASFRSYGFPSVVNEILSSLKGVK